MCGRFTNLVSWGELVRRYRLTDTGFRPNLRPRLNICPTDPVMTVRKRDDGTREGAIVMWWLVPPWAKEKAKGYPMFNARSETAADKPAFREAFRRRRCLVPASGFYEWKDEGGKRKTRYYITTRSGAPLTFAGLWERNERLGVESCTILVCAPNPLMAGIHDRMPVVLREDDWDAWLDAPRQDLLCPALEDDLVAYPVPPDIADDDPPAKIAAPPIVTNLVRAGVRPRN